MVFDPLPVFESGCLMDTALLFFSLNVLKDISIVQECTLQCECTSNYPDGQQCSTESLK